MSKKIDKNLNELIDPQVQMLVRLLDDMGLPSKNIMAEAKQRQIISKNLPDLIKGLPPEVKTDARYLSKFVINATFGLFDNALNAIWNEVVLKLREKAVTYGLEAFYDSAVKESKKRKDYETEDNLASLKDHVLLRTCRKLGLISVITHKKLQNVLNMRNEVGISHPNNHSIDAYKLMGWLEDCIQGVLKDDPTKAALWMQDFIKNLKKGREPLDDEVVKSLEQKFSELPIKICEGLLESIFGIYVSEDTDPAVRKNISSISIQLWRQCQDPSKYKLGDLLEDYNTRLDRGKHKLGEQFFDYVGCNRYRPKSHREIIVGKLIAYLRSNHNGRDDFHHEAQLAHQLYSYNPDQSAVLEKLAQRLFETVLMCCIGKSRYGPCQGVYLGVSPVARHYYDKILFYAAGDKYAHHVMASLSVFEINFRLADPICAKNAKTALELLKQNLTDERLIQCADYLISNIEKNRYCVSSAEFKKLSQGYIK